MLRRHLTLLAVVACFYPVSTSEASRAVGDASAARQIAPEEGQPRTVYRRMTYQGLMITVPEEVHGLPQALQQIDADALRFIHKKIGLGTQDKR